MEEINICRVCGFSDTMINTEDVTYCNECYAIEQGFDELYPWLDGFYLDDDNRIYDDSDNIIGMLFEP